MASTTHKDSGFLSLTQRAGFVWVTMPIINILYLSWVPLLAPNPWLSFGVGLITMFFGATLLTLGRKTGKYFFHPLVMVLNGLVAFAFCAVSGDAPSFIVGMAYIGASTVLLKTLPEVLFFIPLGIAEILLGSYLAGKQPLYLLIILVILLCYAVVLVRFLQFTIKQAQEIVQAKNEIEEKKELIEEKNKSITDSINYALRIQQAKLPQKHDIFAALPQSFVMFKPKDIVSGDFYFFYQKQNTVYLAAADCTGHGVPGALMSMIGMERLEDTLQQLDAPADILQQLNRAIKSSLRQTGSDESTRDGMDIALCKINAANGQVTYAGANRPLWIIRKDATGIEEIKATKKAIGGLTADDTQFASHEINLQAGDTIYLFSDGFADTFSGEKNKKLTTKKFKELLTGIQHLDMPAQGVYLEDFMEQWKAGTEQVDDILVMGVRI